jgi:hypothetical protein
MGMSMKNICSKLVIRGGMIAILIISSKPGAFATRGTGNG